MTKKIRLLILITSTSLIVSSVWKEHMNIDYIQRIIPDSAQSYFLFGPQGTGKSTMVIERYPDALLIDLRKADVRYRLTAQPYILQDLVEAQPDGTTIIIDEIHKVPDLLPIVHILIEKKRGWKFILPCSSMRKLRKQGVDLLGGRALKKILHPFMACELGNLFDIDDALLYGLLPLRFGQTNPCSSSKVA